MTTKQQEALGAILSLIPDDTRENYKELAEYAISLGYTPSLKGAKKDYADFTNSKLKRTIMKINANPDFRGISMKFFALPEYNGVFDDAIKARLDCWKRLGYSASCFGCGKCDGTQGCNCVLPDGSNGFLCGFGVLPIPSFTAENIPEIKEAMKIQDEFFKAHTV